MLSALLLASPLVNPQIDIKSVAANFSIASSKEEIIRMIERKGRDPGSQTSTMQYLGVASCRGLHPYRFVIQASTYEQAYEIIQGCVVRINSSELIQRTLDHDSRAFMGGLVSDEVASRYELYKFIEYASVNMDPLILIYDGKSDK